ncbi:MAG: molybdopterin-dependent oxidoreductase [Actinomycetota bacterium]|nr:molybdopterin-dependent oxidoreductase [Actinomycetota bacterium]
MPTSGLITVAVNSDGTVSFSLPRAEVGQGITTAVARASADEIAITVDKVRVTPPTLARSSCGASSPAARTRCTRSSPRSASPPPPRGGSRPTRGPGRRDHGARRKARRPSPSSAPRARYRSPGPSAPSSGGCRW